MPSNTFRLRWAHIALAILIVLAAIALRMAVVADRAANDERFIPPFLSDSETYFRFAGDVLGRSYPFKSYDYQPGVIYFYAVLMAVVGKSVALLRLALCVIDGLAVGAVIAAGWLLTRRAWGGWLAGLLMALYPVSVYYATTISIEPFAAMLLSVWLVIVLKQMDQTSHLRTVLLGLLTGAMFVTRSNVAAVTVIYLLWWAAQRPGWRAWFTDLAVIAAGTMLVISPFTAWNLYINPSQFQLLQSGGWWQLYSANNRDGDGTGGSSAAFAAEDRLNVSDQSHWREALVRDFAINPMRFGGLLLRKAAIFWSDAEPGNNDDFYIIREISPVLQALPAVSFPYLAALAFIGLWMLGFDRRDTGLFFWGVIGVLFAGVMISFALSRFRYAVVIPLFPLGAYAIVRLIEWGKQTQSALPDWTIRGWIGRMGVPLVLLLVLWGFPRWGLTGNPPPVPPKATYNSLPADAIPLHVTFGDEVILEGWRTAPYAKWWPWAAQGWANLDTYPAYTVELFWSIKAETEVEYQFFIGITENDIRYGSLDRALGTVSYPPMPTNIWQPGTIYSELISFQPDANMPQEESLPVRIGVYTREGTIFTQGDAITQIPITDPADLTGVVLQTVALYDDVPENVSVPETAIHFGTAQTGGLDLIDVKMPAAAPGEMAQWHFTWQATSDISGDYNLFVHVMDANNELASQFGGAPMPDLLTSNWRPGTPMIAEVDVPMPDKAGEYTVYIGLIDAQTGDRFATDAPDNRPQIGTITVK